MGQKVNPVGFRVGVIRTWDSRWYAKGQQYFDNLHEDIKLRKYLKEKLKHAGVAKIEIERAHKKVKVIISTARPGVVIGKKGTGIDALKADVQKQAPTNEVFLSIQEVRKPDMDAQLVAESIAMPNTPPPICPLRSEADAPAIVGDGELGSGASVATLGGCSALFRWLSKARINAVCSPLLGRPQR